MRLDLQAREHTYQVAEIDLTYKRPNGEVRLASEGAHISSGRKLI